VDFKFIAVANEAQLPEPVYERANRQLIVATSLGWDRELAACVRFDSGTLAGASLHFQQRVLGRAVLRRKHPTIELHSGSPRGPKRQSFRVPARSGDDDLAGG